MTNAKRIFIFVAVILELIIITLLSFRAIRNTYEKLGRSVSINITPKDNVIFTKINSLKNFYEPVPNSVQKVDPVTVKSLGYPAGTTIQYSINDDGLNQLTSYSVYKQAKVYRILTLGDSFTFGENVDTKDNYPTRLEEILNSRMHCKNISSFQVINLGVYGYDINYSVARYNLRGKKYDPDLVLWFIINDDFNRVDELLIPKVKTYDDSLRREGKYYTQLQEGKFGVSWSKAESDVINELGGESSVLSLQSKYLQELNNYYSGPLVVFTFPFTAEKYTSILRSFANSRKDIYYYSSIPNVEKENDGHLPDFHPTAMGYQEIANNLFTYLKRSNIIPCSK